MPLAGDILSRPLSRDPIRQRFAAEPFARLTYAYPGRREQIEASTSAASGAGFTIFAAAESKRSAGA
jgi:hypothetical protein